jgi:hypothetical protein
LASAPRGTLVRVSATETMRQFALALLEAADEDGDVGAMTRYLADRTEVLDQEAMVGISAVAVSFLALTAGVSFHTAAASLLEGASG